MLQGTTGKEKEHVTLECKLSKPNKKVTWLKNGKPIKSGAKCEISNEGTSYTLTIPRCETGDAGEYSIKVDGEDTSCSAKLTVEGSLKPHNCS